MYNVDFFFIKTENRNALTPIPNWELLKPRGYRFFMPGSVGPAWYDAYTTGYNLPQVNSLISCQNIYDCVNRKQHLSAIINMFVSIFSFQIKKKKNKQN